MWALGESVASSTAVSGSSMAAGKSQLWVVSAVFGSEMELWWWLDHPGHW